MGLSLIPLWDRNILDNQKLFAANVVFTFLRNKYNNSSNIFTFVKGFNLFSDVFCLTYLIFFIDHFFIYIFFLLKVHVLVCLCLKSCAMAEILAYQICLRHLFTREKCSSPRIMGDPGDS